MDGLAGRLFTELYAFDRPFNQAPSLHLSITVLLWSLYSRHLRGVGWWAMRAWLVLVGFSPLTTYQHHFLDLPTGIWVGWLAMVLVPFERPHRGPVLSRDPARWVFVRRYAVGGVTAAVLAVWLGGVAWWLLWVAGALLLVGLIYSSGDPGWFGKRDGGLPGQVKGLLAPYLIGVRINLRFWTRGDAPAHLIEGGVWLGRSPRRAELDAGGIASVVDLAPELEVDAGRRPYALVPILDRMVPAGAQLNAAVSAIEGFAEVRPTLVCCAAGYSRSAAAVAAWLMATGRAGSAEKAIEQIRGRRPRIRLTRRDRERLEEWKVRRRRKPKWARIDDCDRNRAPFSYV